MTTVKFNQPALRNLDSFLDNFFNELPVASYAGKSFPAVNITETDSAYELEMNVPGRNKEDFKISVDKGILTIAFEKSEEKKEETKKIIKREFVTQSFKRSFTLDDKINADNIDARYENGILYLSLPKKEEVKVLAKEIAVK